MADDLAQAGWLSVTTDEAAAYSEIPSSAADAITARNISTLCGNRITADVFERLQAYGQL